MSADLTSELFQQGQRYWETVLRPRVEGLSDDEYLWTPIERCSWSITANADGWIAEVPPPDMNPQPVTTLAWRVAHVSAVLAGHAELHFRDGLVGVGGPIVAAPSAAGALRLLDDSWAAWRDGVQRLGQSDLARRVTSRSDPSVTFPFARVVQHVNLELIHHGAEIALLRDLYAAATRA